MFTHSNLYTYTLPSKPSTSGGALLKANPHQLLRSATWCCWVQKKILPSPPPEATTAAVAS